MLSEKILLIKINTSFFLSSHFIFRRCFVAKMKDEFTPYTPSPEKIIELYEKLEKGETLGKRSKRILICRKILQDRIFLLNIDLFPPAP